MQLAVDMRLQLRSSSDLAIEPIDQYQHVIACGISRHALIKIHHRRIHIYEIPLPHLGSETNLDSIA